GPSTAPVPSASPVATTVGPSPSQGMTLRQLKEALSTMPNVDPRAVRAISLDKARALYDRLTAQETPSTQQPGSLTSPASAEVAPTAAATPEPVGAGTASPAPGGGLLTPRPASENVPALAPAPT